MNCGTKSVIYLISCKKCGVQYVGETSHTLRCRFNNHRNRLKQLCGLYLYHHFSSDGHTLDDISIMPIEEVVSEPDDGITLGCKRLQREEFWYRELCTMYRLKHGFECHTGYNGTVATSARGPQARGRKPLRLHYSPYGARSHALTYFIACRCRF